MKFVNHKRVVYFGDMIQTCKIHGAVEYTVTKDGKRLRCKICGVEAVKRRHAKMKLLALQYKGGKCEICGYNKCARAMHFHHKNPTEKSFGISKGNYSIGWEKIKEELDKCQLLCSNCHSEVHEELEKVKSL